jgi:two-component system LytT family sensor kinase
VTVTSGSVRRWLVWTAVAIAAWTAESVFYSIGLTDVARRGGHPISFWTTWEQTLVTGLVGWASTTLLCLWLASRWPVYAKPAYLFVHLFGLVAAILGRALVVVLLNPVVGWFPAGVPPLPDLLVQSVTNNLLYYVLLDGLAHAVALAAAARTRERQFAKARMDALIAQIQPHFLFNSLNTIAAAVHDDPDQAEATIIDLAALLRYTLDRDSAELVPLTDELAAATAYLRIEQRRLPDQLGCTVEVAPDVRHAGVPAFILQPLLENAVRHGLARRDGAGHLRLSAAVTSGTVTIRVEDDGVGVHPGAELGVGLSNVEARLQQHFGPAAGLRVEPRPDGGTLVRLVLPHVAAGAGVVLS